MFVGEMGYPRHEFLSTLQFWEINAIMKGYRNRYRDQWTAIRWATFNIMCAMPFTDMTKAGIHQPSDLIKFPWDGDSMADLPTDEEINEMRKRLQEANANK